MNTTSFLGMSLPYKDDNYEISIFNNNAEIVDSKLEQLDGSVSILETNELSSTPPIVTSAQGEAVGITDSSDRSLQGLIVYGKSTQNGTPTPDAPVEITSTSDSGSVTVTVSDGGENSQTLTIPTSIGLYGLPVTSGGNYTDANGQQWICDEIDLARGVKVQRTHKFGVTDNFTVADYNALGTYARVQVLDDYEAVSQTTAIPALCNILPWKISISADEPHFYVNVKNIWAFVPIAELSTQDAAGAKEWLIDHNAEFLYALATPIETPLTEEQKADYSALMSYFPTTTATIDNSAGMKLSYIADTKTYVDNQFKMLFALISSN